ncbi:MAG TPA: efflux RND transporter permease subunit [Phycisphaerales bacterium]|nr:efflux RND transporter permease subunit [Phycisphaerales bacterium]HMP37067.1 efflux RND transporter permease subunit [Phycisphaerales bacterium]
MGIASLSVRQPISVAVGVILLVMAGLLALQRLPIQLTPNVDDTIVSVTTRWEGASPEEIEQEVIDKQEEKLQGIPNLREITSTSLQGEGQIRLEFALGTDKNVALRDVSDKLREVPSYPENVDQPVVEASDPESRDYIAWIVFSTTDPALDIRTLQDFAEDRIKPVLSRVPGISEVNVLGGREREVQVRFDPQLLARRDVTLDQLVAALRDANRNVSAGELRTGKLDVRLRTVSQFEDPRNVEETVIAVTPAGIVRVGDVAEVVETFKKPTSFVRSKSRPVIAINAQREVGSNVIEVMAGLRAAIARVNEPGGLLDTQAQALGLSGGLQLEQVYDQTVYIDDALAMVRTNIWLGGSLAVLALMLFLRSLRAVAIVALAIPVCLIGAIVFMVTMGRSVNVISLAGMAFAVGMVLDNAIVVLENTFRHLHMGKSPVRAAADAAREVGGAVVASTLTTLAAFVPILLVQEEAGQLFRDIALALCAAVLLSLVVSLTVVPAAASRWLRPHDPAQKRGPLERLLSVPQRLFGWFPGLISGVVYRLTGSVWARIVTIAVLTTASIGGSLLLMPPADYLPSGNRNLIFGLLIPPPGYNLDTQTVLAERIESTFRPYWEVAAIEDPSERAAAAAKLPEVPTFDYVRGGPGPPVVPPPIDNYFFVAFPGTMFHGAVTTEPSKVADLQPLFAAATSPEFAPGVLGFAFQIPLFRLGGTTGSAVKIDFTGDDLRRVSDSAAAAYMTLAREWGFGAVRPNPSNFSIPGPELRVLPDRRRLADLGMTPRELGLAVRTSGDGAIIGEYRIAGESIDLKLISAEAVDADGLDAVADMPVATPRGGVVPLGSLGELRRTIAPQQINRVDRQRAVTLEFTAPPGLPLEEAIGAVDATIAALRDSGQIAPNVVTTMTGSASKLRSVRSALLGDGTLMGTATSSLFLAIVVVYLLMVVLFQSWLQPLVIMFSVPLATLGGFAALALVHWWSLKDRYLPVQNLDVLTMLGFVILVGTVVNNAILIVHQARNFMRGVGDGDDDRLEPMPPRRAIAESVRTRVRPIFMTTITSVGGLLPLVLMPGSGSELYRGLGAVVLGGLVVSTLFTLLLVPLLFSFVARAPKRVTEPAMVGRPRDLRAAPAEPAIGAAPPAAPAVANGAPPRPSTAASAELASRARQGDHAASDPDARRPAAPGGGDNGRSSSEAAPHPEIEASEADHSARRARPAAHAPRPGHPSPPGAAE